MSDTSQLTLLVYTPVGDDSISTSLGLADYSYYFVAKRFLPLLDEFGTVVRLNDLRELPALCEAARAEGHRPVLISFAPPQQLPLEPPCPMVPVYAWEFDTIPDEQWGSEPRTNWVSAFARSIAAITHSEYSVAATRRSMGDDYPVISIPAPVWDGFNSLPDTGWTGQPRTLHLNGVVVDSRDLHLDGEPTFDEVELVSSDCSVELSGVVFTSVLNPDDGRKNWYDMLTAFVWAFRDNPDVTLVLKLVHSDTRKSCEPVLLEMRKVAPYRCRVVAIHGFLDDNSFAELLRASTFAVNSSHGEGQCLPLMEYMSAGVPAVTPDHTSMADYANESNSVRVNSWREWTAWPQDSRLLLRCHRYRIDWESLVTAYQQAWTIATEQPELYENMRRAAATDLQRHCSQEVARQRLTVIFEEINSRLDAESAEAPSTEVGG